MKSFRTVAAAITLAILAPAASAATVTNGSFEDIGSLQLNGAGWNFFTAIPGWTGDPTGEIQSDKTIGQVDAQDGQYYAELDTNQNSTIYQDVFLDPGAYFLSFFYSPRVNNPAQGTNDMNYALAGLLSGSVNAAPNGAFPYKAWTEVTGRFEVASAGTYRLSFSGAGAENESNGCGDCGALIDNISISPVPLPASVLFLLAGIGGLGAMRARQRAS